MKNLAGNPDCDGFIKEELRLANIPIIEAQDSNGHEVNAKVTGKLGQFIFTRYWYYWVVKGRMPLDIAKILYEDPIGKEAVRVAGNCGCPPPEEGAIYYDDDWNRLISDPDNKQQTQCEALKARFPDIMEKIRFVYNAKDIARKVFVECYHIDTQEGLNLFTKMILLRQL